MSKAPINVRVDVSGAIAGMASLSGAVRGRVLRAALKAGNEPPYKLMRLMVPVRYRLLLRSIGHREKVYRESGNAAGVVGARVGFGKVVKTNRTVTLRETLRAAKHFAQSKRSQKRIVKNKATKKAKNLRFEDPVKYAHMADAKHPFLDRVRQLSAPESAKAAEQTLLEELTRALS